MSKITEEAITQIISGSMPVAPQPNPHNARVYMPCLFKITVLHSSREGASLKLQGVDPKTHKPLVDIGTFFAPVKSDIFLESYTDKPFIAAVWPVKLT